MSQTIRRRFSALRARRALASKLNQPDGPSAPAPRPMNSSIWGGTETPSPHDSCEQNCSNKYQERVVFWGSIIATYCLHLAPIYSCRTSSWAEMSAYIRGKGAFVRALWRSCPLLVLLVTLGGKDRIVFTFHHWFQESQW